MFAVAGMLNKRTLFFYLIVRCLFFNSILVGAPRDNITDATAPPKVRQIVRPGAVYQCPYSSRRNDCVAVKLDVEGQ